MKKRIIVIGGGFAGLQFIKNLKPGLFEVMLIDRLNHHQFQPLFYQVATSQIEPTSISFPLRKIFQDRKDVTVRMAEVLTVDPQNNSVTTTAGSFAYDELVIASGGKTNYYGNSELEKHTLSLKTTYEAIRIRNVILENFENILNAMSSLAKKSSEKYLKGLGVHLRTGVFVRNYDGYTLQLSNGELLKSKNVIWTAGITGNLISGLSQEVTAPGARIRVDRTNRVQGYENIYAIGDIAYMETPGYPKGHPQVANVAINQGKNLARNFARMTTGRKLKEYEYKDLGSMATVGRNKAIVDLPLVSFHGYLAWYFWMFLHLMLILSVRNKLIIFINWAWNYFTKNSSLRLILKVNS